MRITLENTTKIVELTIDGQTVPARVWQGEVVSYTIEHSSHSACITCHHCGYTSYNYNDVVERYCGKCKRFHADHPVIPVQAFITRIAPEVPKDDPRIDELTAEFSRELERTADPRPTVEAIPLQMIV
jgi:hypothetical protein